MPYHVDTDTYEPDDGGIQIHELFGPVDNLFEKLRENPLIDAEAMLELLLAWREQIRPFVNSDNN